MSTVIYETKQEDGILLNANESYNNISKTVLKEFQDALSSVDFHRYPQSDATALCKAYGAYVDLDAECIMAGNGSDELLGLMIGMCLRHGQRVYTLSPDFSMYDYYVGMYKGEMVKYPLAAGADFDVDDFIEQGRRANVDMILFSNPNNPTGQMLPIHYLCKIAEAFPHIPVIFDEAYADFSSASMIPYLSKYQNMFVTRTLSKAFGLASLRCGFLCATPSTMKRIRPFKVPYNVNTITQTLAQIALNHVDQVKEFVQEVRSNRDEFYLRYQSLSLTGITLYPSQANYLYGQADDKTKFLQALKVQDIIIRDYEDNSFRITIGSKEQNELVLTTLQQVYGEE